MNSLRVHNLFRELTSNSLSFSEFTLNSLSISRIHWQFSHSLDNFLKNYEFTICFVNSLLIHYIFRRFTLNSLRVFYLLRECTLNSSSFSRMHFEFTRSFANSPWIHLSANWQLLCAFIFNSLSISRNHFQFNIFFCKFPFNLIALSWISLLSASRMHSQITMYFANEREFTPFFTNSLSIHYIFR